VEGDGWGEGDAWVAGRRIEQWPLQRMATAESGYYKEWLLQRMATTKNGYYMAKRWLLRVQNSYYAAYPKHGEANKKLQP